MNTLQSILRTVAALLAGAALLIAGHAVAADVRNVDVRQGHAMRNNGALLLDVRELYEFDEVHAPGSKLIPLGELEYRLNEIRGYTGKPVVIICRSGRRSARAAEVLGKLGFTDVHNVSGGMLAWLAAGLPVVKPGR